MPKVSVIVPNYNHAPYLEKRLQTILNQTCQDFELIYLDDASTDNSNEVFAKFSNDPRIRAIFNQTNSGSPFKQWNKGIREAKGDYIWIAESDDFTDITFLETLVEILDKHIEVGLVYCQSLRVDSSGSCIGTMHFWTDHIDKTRWRHDFFNNGVEECKNYLTIKNTIPNASAVVFRHCHITESSSDIEEFKLCGDWLFWIEILLKSDVAFISKPLNYFRAHNNTVREIVSSQTYIVEYFNIFLYLSKSINLPDETLHNFQVSISKLYFGYYQSNSIDYLDLLNFYKKILWEFSEELSLNYSPLQLLRIHLKILAEILSFLKSRTLRSREKIT